MDFFLLHLIKKMSLKIENHPEKSDVRKHKQHGQCIDFRLNHNKEDRKPFRGHS